MNFQDEAMKKIAYDCLNQDLATQIDSDTLDHVIKRIIEALKRTAKEYEKKGMLRAVERTEEYARGEDYNSKIVTTVSYQADPAKFPYIYASACLNTLACDLRTEAEK